MVELLQGGAVVANCGAALEQAVDDAAQISPQSETRRRIPDFVARPSADGRQPLSHHASCSRTGVEENADACHGVPLAAMAASSLLSQQRP
ncbi:hypothetical protein G6F57_022664 [Rhizopus arrhizus]|nr:hypothetical protein G6F57_022664 [Rhizopus arrhizus]